MTSDESYNFFELSIYYVYYNMRTKTLSMNTKFELWKLWLWRVEKKEKGSEVALTLDEGNGMVRVSCLLLLLAQVWVVMNMYH